MRKIITIICLFFIGLSLGSCSFDAITWNSSISADTIINCVNNISENMMEDCFKVVVTYYRKEGLINVPLNTKTIGTGVLLLEDDDYYYVVTNRHVIEYRDGEYTSIAISLIDSCDESRDAKLFYQEDNIDLAVLQMIKSKTNPAKYRYELNVKMSSTEPKQDSYCFAVGTPEGQRNAITIGQIYGYSQLECTDCVNPSFNFLVHTAKLHNGNSGGMLLDTNCELIGINTVGATNFGGAISTKDLKNFLKRANLIQEEEPTVEGGENDAIQTTE